MNFIEELKWRGMIHDMMPGTEETLLEGLAAGYIGFDPTAPSLTIGNFVTVMMLLHFQRAGHKPIALIGGATGMIGDPSGKDTERKLLDPEILENNQETIKIQLSKFLDFNSGSNSAEILNNYDWFKSINTLTFLRDAGKYLTVNYLLSKGFIKDRLKKEDISFTEFNYILMQAYDFLWLLKEKNCILQMGGSDQWGNITAGTELIRKKLRKKVFGLTCPLLTKADGSKFGKTEEGNIWLDPKMTSPYKFYQFWINSSDEDAGKLIRYFTLFSKKEIEELEKQHTEAPHKRLLQKALAKDITIRVHSEEDLNNAINASEILFGTGTTDALKTLEEDMILSVMEGVPQIEINRFDLQNAENVTNFLSVITKGTIFSSKGEAKRMIRGGGVSINKTKILEPGQAVDLELLQDKYLLVQKGRKSYYLVKVI